MESDRNYDVIIYGATGFTGQYAALELARTYPEKKIAIAGRNESQLQRVVNFITQETGENKEIGHVIADNNDKESLLRMCGQCRVVVTCVGPYRWYGEAVVQSCIEAGCHYVDISGEPEFLLKMQNKYHKEALEKGVHVVGSCGVDSVPADLGLELLRDLAPGQLTRAESYLHLIGGGGGNYGTYLTLVHSIANYTNLKEQQKIAGKTKLPYVGPKLNFKNIGYSKSEGKWFLPFKGADPSVVRRTQSHEWSEFDKTPLQYGCYFAFDSFFHVLGVLMFVATVFLLTRFKLGIKLLEMFPRFFSFGIFSKRTYLDKDEIENSGFKMVFHGEGYVETQEPGVIKNEPDFRSSLNFIGPNPGYIFTSAAVVAAAVTLLDDPLRHKGGVLTPASALLGTRYLDRLKERGVKIEVL